MNNEKKIKPVLNGTAGDNVTVLLCKGNAQ